ncbi:MAG: hypothetical protein QOD64_1221 [Verrucomicrobiota bacterium]|jgi:hypothetical protein
MPWQPFIGTITQRGSLRGLSFWFFLGMLIVVPWLYGGTTSWSIELINLLLALVLLLWGASLVVDRRAPETSALLLIITTMVLALGWWMVWNARATYDSTFRVFVPVTPVIASLAGSSDYVLSCAAMIRATLLLGVIALVADMVQRQRWLLRLWVTLAIAAVFIALLGLLQKATHAPMIFWQPAPPEMHYAATFFASFYYHANAGAFLNLVLPPAVGLACWSFARDAHGVRATLASVIAGMVVLAITSNTSRMAQLVGLVLLVALGWLLLRPLLARAREWELRSIVIGTVVLALAVFAVAQASRLDQPLLRWKQLAKNLPADQRWTADRAALSAVGAAGFFGFGPGTFRAVFPHYQQTMKGELQGTWRFLHDDYLQTLLEWGWLGSAVLAALFFGGIGVGVRNYLRAKEWSHRQRIMLSCSLLALGGVAIHATVDFPLQILSLQLLVATYLGVCWGSGRWERSEIGSRDR